MPDFIAESAPKARKDHRCDVCGMTIEAGTVYTAQTYALDGWAYTWRQHTECAEIVAEVLADGDDLTAGDGENWLDAMGEEDAVNAVRSDAAKARVRAWFAEHPWAGPAGEVACG